MRRLPVLLCAGIALAVSLSDPVSVSATEAAHDCDHPGSARRVAACTALIESADITESRRATAYANRALAYSLRGEYETAIRDYDQAIRLFPDYAIALNNRAWAYFKWGRAAQGMPDVQRSLQLDPLSPHSLDTRAHIYQSLGDASKSMRDYEAAMMFGGARMVTLYQCGLKMHRLYDGPNDGVVSGKLLAALKVCIERGPRCDPLPPSEECVEAIS